MPSRARGAAQETVWLESRARVLQVDATAWFAALSVFETATSVPEAWRRYLTFVYGDSVL